jgi:16S rRNA (cytosine967-C5)-methyltransferase
VDRGALRPLVDLASLERGPLARFHALRMLIDADDGNRYIDQILDERLKADPSALRDRYLIQEIAYGAVRHRNTIDAILDHYIQFSMRRHDVAVRWGLRLAVYQLVYLSRVPPHAAIHGTVEALKAAGGLHLRDVGFANAVLRRVQNDIEAKGEEPLRDEDDRCVIPARHGWCRFRKPVLPPPSVNRQLFLALKYSHPKWLLARWLERFGEKDTLALCLENNRVPLVTAILTGKEPSREAVIESLAAANVQVEAGAVPEAIRLRRPGDVRDLEPFAKAWIRIQDETAKRIGDALEPPPGARVLDLCSGPGTKAAQILERIGPEGRLCACDVDDEKLERVRENLARVGGNFTLSKVPREPKDLRLEGRYTHVLVDAPCSNTGVLARRPEARWRIHIEDFQSLSRLQGKLLDAVAPHLEPGGRLVYATCSIEPEENGQVVAAFLRRNPDFAEMGSRLFLPQRDGSDGGYYAVLERRR